MAASLEETLRVEGQAFLKNLLGQVSAKKIALSAAAIDHLCYRTATVEEYEDVKTRLQASARLLGENLIGGRRIAAFKLSYPLRFQEAAVDVFELPEPKKGSPYPTGFEHAEFVVKETFSEFKTKHPRLEFDDSGAMKPSNPELRVRLDGGISLKIHAQSLEDVIAAEAAVCKRCQAPGARERIPPVLRAFAVIGFAIAHLGAIVGLELDGVFCPPCRRALGLRYGLAAGFLAAAALTSGIALLGLIFG